MPTKPKTIDDYLARVSATQRAALEKLRRDIKAAAPAAEDAATTSQATASDRGCWSRSGGEDHCAFYPGVHPIRAHENELAGYDLAKGTIRFPADKLLPAGLVKMLVKTRIAEYPA